MTATLESKIRIGDDVVFSELEGESVVLNIQSGIYYTLNEVATRAWALLQERGEVGAVYQALAGEYSVPKEQLRDDLLILVDRLASLGLVQVVGP